MTDPRGPGGLPAAALPAPAGAYQTPVGSDYGSAQRYANTGSMQADAAGAYRLPGQPTDVGVRADQAIFASRGPESDADPRPDAGQGQAGNTGQNGTPQAGAGGPARAGGEGRRDGPSAGRGRGPPADPP